MPDAKLNNTCWIPGCERERGYHLLCDAHVKRYLTDEKARAIVYTLWLRVSDRLSFGERLWLGLRRLYHVITARPTFFVEHFPMETLFLYHYRRVYSDALRLVGERAYSITDSQHDVRGEEVRERLRDLLADFAVPGNAHLVEARFVLSQVEQAPRPNTSNSYELQAWNAPTFVPAPKTIALLFIMSLVVSVLGIVTHVVGTLTLVFPFDQRPGMLLATLTVAFLFALSGSRFLGSIPAVVQAAIDGRLYSEPRDNSEFLTRVLWVKASLARLTDFRVGGLGYATGLGVLGVIAIARETSGLNLLASLAVAVPALTVYGFTLIFYGALVSVNLLAWSMPKQRYAFDIYDARRQMGVEAVTGLLHAFLTYNLVAYVVIVVILSGTEGLARLVGLAILLVIGVLRLGSVRRAIAGLLALRRESRQAIHAERNAIASLPIADRLARETFLDSVRYDPFGTVAGRKAVRWTITTLLLPLLFLLLDRFWADVGARLKKAFSLLRESL